MAGRPKVSDPKQTLGGRVAGSVVAKFLAIAKKERRKPSELVALVVEDYVAAYEKENGPISLPSPGSSPTQ